MIKPHRGQVLTYDDSERNKREEIQGDNGVINNSRSNVEITGDFSEVEENGVDFHKN